MRQPRVAARGMQDPWRGCGVGAAHGRNSEACAVAGKPGNGEGAYKKIELYAEGACQVVVKR